jgi:hypothetical protein
MKSVLGFGGGGATRARIASTQGPQNLARGWQLENVVFVVNESKGYQWV